MKRIRLIMALALVAAIGLGTAPASAGEYTVENLFTVRYDSSAYTIDDMTYADENVGDGYHWFFILYNDDFMFDASMETLDGYEEFSTISADESARHTYLEDILDAYSDDGIKLITVMEAGESKVPFYIFFFQNEDGPYLMAETVIRGYGIDFMAYYNDSDKPVDALLMNSLMELVNTFVPTESIDAV